MMRIERALAGRGEQLTMFFRDDDAGWDMPALDRLLTVFAERACPVDLAVIPAVLDGRSADHLNAWRVRAPSIGLHQHGHAHLNYEPAGTRKCEFGAARPVERQCTDIAIGRERLASLLGTTDPIFTPPWNRCSDAAVGRLRGLGFAGYSSDRANDGADGLAMLPVSFDWSRAQREGELTARLAAALSHAAGPLGIMLHHAAMDDDERAVLAIVLACLAQAPNIRCVPMRDLLESLS